MVSAARTAALLLVVLLGATAGAVAQAPAPDGVQAPAATTDGHVTPSNTTAVLRSAAGGRAEFVSPSVDLSVALGGQRADLDARFRTYALNERYETSDSAAGRRALLSASLDRVEDRLGDVTADERRTRRAYVNGTTTGADYLATLSRLSATAGELQRRLTQVQNYARRVPDTQRIEQRAARDEAELVMLQGPVRARATEAFEGTSRPDRFYLAASRTGVALSRLDDRNGTYVREAADRANFRPAVQTRPSEREMLDRIDALYPWGWNHSSHVFSESGRGIYRVVITHDHGQLTAYIDGSTRNVFSEVQTKFVGGLPTGPGTAVRRGDGALAVNRTYPGGPLRVLATNATGAPRDAVVRVNGTVVGETGDDGVLWTVGPSGQYVVSATTPDGETVTLIARAVEDDQAA
ncbi:MAG: hypothetical protein ABEJ70_08085 [Halobacteriaceae archaeon]